MMIFDNFWKNDRFFTDKGKSGFDFIIERGGEWKITKVQLRWKNKASKILS